MFVLEINFQDSLGDCVIRKEFQIFQSGIIDRNTSVSNTKEHSMRVILLLSFRLQVFHYFPEMELTVLRKEASPRIKEVVTCSFRSDCINLSFAIFLVSEMQLAPKR